MYNQIAPLEFLERNRHRPPTTVAVNLGAWPSLVGHLPWAQVVIGSNPVAPRHPAYSNRCVTNKEGNKVKRRIKYGSCECVDIGCHKSKKPGYIGIDMRDCGQEILWDVTHGIPLPDESVSKIYTSHFLEHIRDEDVPEVIFEMLRISKPGADVEIRVPHSNTLEAKYVTHFSMWDETRIKGIIRSLPPKPNFKIIEMEKKGIELCVNLKVVK